MNRQSRGEQRRTARQCRQVLREDEVGHGGVGALRVQRVRNIDSRTRYRIFSLLRRSSFGRSQLAEGSTRIRCDCVSVSDVVDQKAGTGGRRVSVRPRPR